MHSQYAFANIQSLKRTGLYIRIVVSVLFSRTVFSYCLNGTGILSLLTGRFRYSHQPGPEPALGAGRLPGGDGNDSIHTLRAASILYRLIYICILLGLTG